MTAFVRLLCFVLLGSALSVAAAATPYFVDGDGDEVSDEIDDCPYTHPGVKVDAKGCPLNREDADLDGMPDEDDSCPYSAPGAQIDAQGCALDSDFDGIANGLDRCPQTALARVVDARGCASNEQMSATLSPAKPARTLPASPRVLPPVLATPQPAVEAPVRTAPSPIIATTPAPLAAAVLAAPVSSIAESPEMVLRFANDSGRLGKGDLAAIESYAGIFKRRLQLKPAAKLRIKAYADRRETDSERLAAARLAIVRRSLIEQGIPEDRLEVRSSLLESTDAGTARRVEARLSE
ncbi:MAG: thrombospondin type 3 repeat-containing protein [Pseudomonadota bacterium]